MADALVQDLRELIARRRVLPSTGVPLSGSSCAIAMPFKEFLWQE
jgi:hypothetical protein